MDDLLRDLSSDPTPEVIAKLKQIEKSPLDPELKAIYSNNPFPKSDNSEIHFKFQNNDLVILTVHKNTSQNDLDFCISYLLYSFLYWKELSDYKDKIESLLIYLKSLIAFSTHDIIKKIVLYLFSFYFYQEEHKNIQQFEIYLQEYYSIEQFPTKKSFPLIPAYLSLYEKGNLLDYAIKYVMNNEITPQEALILVNSMKISLFNLRKEAISLFCLIIPYLNQNKTGNIVKEIVQKLFFKIKNSDFSFYIDCNKNTLTKPNILIQNYAVNYEPIKANTFSKIKFDLNSEFVKQQFPTSKIISSDIKENFKMFSRAILSSNTYLLNIFASTLFGKLEEAANNGKFGEIYALLLYTLRKTKKCLLDFIIHPVVFQTDKRDENIGKLVRYGTSIILDERNFSSISFLLNSTINYNFVFENVLRTFIKNINIIVKMCYESSELISLFSRLSKHFQLKRIEGNEDIDNNSLLLFKLIEISLQYVDIIQLSWKDFNFVSSFFSFVCEKPCRKFVLEQLRKFLQLEQINVGNISSVLLNFSMSQRFYIHDEYTIEILIELMNYLNISKIDHISSAKFNDFVLSLVENHFLIRNSDLLEKYLIEILKLIEKTKILTDFAQIMNTISSNLHPLSDTFVDFYLNFSNLERLTEKSAIHVNFLIIELIKDGNFERAKLILSSLHNNYQIFQILVKYYKLDIKILELITASNQIQILVILEMISRNYSSIIFVQKLFCYLKQEINGVNRDLIYEFMFKLLKNTNKKPKFGNYLTENQKKYQISVTEGITFICYIYFDQHDEDSEQIPVIFEIIFENFSSMKVLIEGNTLLFEDTNRQYSVQDKFIRNDWNFFSLSISQKGDTNLTLNDETIYFSTEEIKETITVTVGSRMIENSVKSNHLLSSYMISNLIPQQKIEKIKEKGFKFLNEIKNCFIFEELKEISLTKQNFSSVLVNQCRFDLCYNLFNSWKITNQNKKGDKLQTKETQVKNDKFNNVNEINDEVNKQNQMNHEPADVNKNEANNDEKDKNTNNQREEINLINNKLEEKNQINDENKIKNQINDENKENQLNNENQINDENTENQINDENTENQINDENDENQIKNQINDENLYEKVLSLFELMLNFNQKSEIIFFKRDGFRIISYLITNGPREFITFKLYNKFYEIYLSLTVNELKIQMMNEILLNSTIWSKSKSEDELQIYIHWANELIPTHHSSIAKIKPFKRFLCQISLHYNLFSQLHNFGPEISLRREEIPLEEFRSLFLTILTLVAQNQFSLNDFKLMISFCQTNPDREFSKFVLVCLNNIIHANPCPILEFANQTVDLLMTLSKVSDFSPLVLEIFLFLTCNKIILHDKKDILIYFAKSFECKSIEELKIYINMMKKDSSLLMICCTAAKKIGKIEAVELLFTEIYPSKEFSAEKCWFIYPLFILHMTNSYTRQLILRFLVLCDPLQWKIIFTMIDFLSINCNAKSEFLNAIIIYILSGDIILTENISKIFIDLFKNYIFFNSENKALLSLFTSSPFVTPDIFNHFEMKQTLNNISNFSDLLNFIEKIQIKSQKVTFQLNLDSNGEWIDANLCFNSLSVLEKLNCDDLFYIVCYFLLSSKFKNFEFYVENIFSKNESRNKKNFERLLMFKMYLITKSNDYHCFINDFSCFENFSKDFSFDLQNINEIKSYFENGIKYNMEYQDLSALWALSVEGELHMLKSDLYKGKKSWKSVENFVSSSSLTWKTNEKKHYKRDDTGCYSTCPFKLKVNHNFDDHRDAVNLNHEIELFSQKSDNKKVQNFDRINSSLFRTSICSFLIKWITVSKQNPAEVKIYEKEFYVNFPNGKSKKIRYDIIGLIRHTTYLHHFDSVLLSLINGKTYFMRFRSESERNKFSSEIEKIKSDINISRKMILDDNDQFLQKWVKGELSNFSYLIYLNLVSGRTFRCSNQYPIFPWTLTDYKSDKLNLNDENVYRDLTKPVGALNENRLKMLKKLMECLKTTDQKYYLYSNGPNCPLTLFLLLVRVEPFTSLHIDIQDGKFDTAERQFKSIEQLFENVSNDMNDFRELIPEFFFCPDFLLNKDKFNLGLDNEGNVLLPKWSNNSPFEFVYKMRKSLESDFVSKNLNHWIDLMFGYKQKGDEAVLSDNIFNPDLYDNVWDQKNLTKEQINTLELGLKHLGQMPAQIFDKPHPLKSDNLTQPTVKTGVLKFTKKIVEKGKIFEDFVTFCTETKIFFASISSQDMKKVQKQDKVVGFGEKCVVNENSFVFYEDKIINLSSKVVCFNFCQIYMAIIGDDNIVRILQSNFDVYTSFPYYSGDAIGVEISVLFHSVLVYSQRNICLYNLSGNSDVLSLDFDVNISKVKITNGWGFIVVLTEYDEIFLYTINGDFVKKCHLNEKVTSLETYTTSKGFDSIVLGCKNGVVLESDAIDLTFDKKIFCLNGEIIDAVISMRGSCYYVLIKSGFLYIL